MSQIVIKLLKVFECVIDWVKHELDCRKRFLNDLIEHVRLPLTSMPYIFKKVVDEPLLKYNPIDKDYVIKDVAGKNVLGLYIVANRIGSDGKLNLVDTLDGKTSV